MSDIIEQQIQEIYQTVRMLQEQVFRKVHQQIPTDGCSMGSCPELTMPQFHTMKVVQDHGCMNLKELAEALGVSSPSASTMVDRLVDMGFLARTPSKKDRRVIEIRLSENASDHLSQMENMIMITLGDLLRKIGPHYAEQWCEVYDQVRGALKNEETLSQSNLKRNKD